MKNFCLAMSFAALAVLCGCALFKGEPKPNVLTNEEEVQGWNLLWDGDFPTNGWVGVAAGCMVTEGEISRDDHVRLVRNGIVIYDGALASMRRYKDDVRSVRAGYECGLGLENYQDVHIGDVIEGYKIVEVARTE